MSSATYLMAPSPVREFSRDIDGALALVGRSSAVGELLWFRRGLEVFQVRKSAVRLKVERTGVLTPLSTPEESSAASPASLDAFEVLSMFLSWLREDPGGIDRTDELAAGAVRPQSSMLDIVS